jgi:hypothetical protein
VACQQKAEIDALVIYNVPLYHEPWPSDMLTGNSTAIWIAFAFSFVRLIASTLRFEL